MVDSVKFVKSGITVTVDTIPTDEENLTKALVPIPNPKVTAEQDINEGANVTKIVDILNKVEQRVTIDGFLSNGTVSGDTSSTAVLRKVDLKKIFLAGGVFNVTYEGSSFTANADKLSIRRVDSDGNVGVDGVVEFSVKITIIKGVDL